MQHAVLVGLGLLLLLGCSPAPPAEPDVAAPEPLPSRMDLRPVTDVLQTMEWILDPAADAIWDSAGFIITAEGERDLSPTTAEGWQRALNGAAVVAEVGNLLMMPGREAGPDWVAHAGRMREAAEKAMAAAQARDAEALFDAGGDVYVACRSCHEQYRVPMQQARNAQ